MTHPVILFSILFIILLIALFSLALSISFFFGAPFVITPKKIVQEIINISKLNSNDIIFDLGSGDGRIIIECGKICKRAVGYEINLYLVIWTLMMARINGSKSNAEVHWQNFNYAKLNSATIIYMYILPRFIPSIQKKFKKELKPGTKIISYKFKLDGFKLLKKTKSGIYLYIV